MLFRSLSEPEKIDGKYGVLCLVIGRYGTYRSMARFKRKRDAINFFNSIPVEPQWS